MKVYLIVGVFLSFISCNSTGKVNMGKKTKKGLYSLVDTTLNYLDVYKYKNVVLVGGVDNSSTESLKENIEKGKTRK